MKRERFGFFFCFKNKQSFICVCSWAFGKFKADSHIACRAHAIHLPCRAAKGLECVYPIWFTQCSRVSHMSCHAHAMLRPCRSSQSHGTARPSRDGLWATCPRSASSGYHAEFHEGYYQTHTRLRTRWPVWNQTTLVMYEEKSGSSTLQKWQSVTLLDKQVGYFRLPCGLSRSKWHYRCMAWARHAMCESAFIVKFNCTGFRKFVYRIYWHGLWALKILKFISYHL